MDVKDNKIPMDNPWEWEVLFQCGNSFLQIEHDRTDGWNYTLYRKNAHGATDGGYISGRIYESADRIAETAAVMLGMDGALLKRSALSVSDLNL